jgi:hypothetical protein
LSVNATTDGVVRCPSAFSMTRAALPSITATHELVVPRSMPMTSSARSAEDALSLVTSCTYGGGEGEGEGWR